jgi:hypothetical protein
VEDTETMTTNDTTRRPQPAGAVRAHQAPGTAGMEIPEATYGLQHMVERIRAVGHYGSWHQGVLGRAAARRGDPV